MMSSYICNKDPAKDLVGTNATDAGQNPKKHQQLSSASSSRKSLDKVTKIRSNSSTGVSPLQADQLQVVTTEMNHANDMTAISVGSTYEIDLKNLPPEAPSDLQSVRAVVISEKTRLHVTVNFPSTNSLQNFFGKSPDYAMDVQNIPRKLTRYKLQLGYVEPLMGSKPELDGKFVMTPKMAERLLVRPISCTEYLHQAHLKTFWLIGPDSTQSSEANFKDVQALDDGPAKSYRDQIRGKCMAAGSSTSKSDGIYDPLSQVDTNGQNGSHVEERMEQVTQDLCNNFQNSGMDKNSRDLRQIETMMQLPKMEGQVWKGTRNSPPEPGLDLRSGTTTEEANANSCEISMVTVKAAAELLTQLTLPHGRHGFNGAGRDIQDKGNEELGEGEGSEGPIRWGFRKKVTFGIRRSNDSCDLGMNSNTLDLEPQNGRIIHIDEQKQSSPQEEYNAVPYDFLHSNCGGWTPVASPVQGELYGLRSCSRGVKRALSSSSQSLRERPNKQPVRAAVNILKLPKDMQGRWSSERYKSAQLKLIDIMHERGAVPGKPILRPALREEARKHIGDTGLLDHLLKHMTDTVVNTGERFRRRHNAEGAMEYWLEDSSLMELRKAAGIEDPSWIPPPGWKPGDNLPGRPWEVSRGMSSSEAAEMKQLKDTVEKLQSEMKLLCGRLKGFREKGIETLTAEKKSQDYGTTSNEVPSKFDDELQNKKLEIIAMEVTDFRRELSSLQEQRDQDRKIGSSFSTALDRFQRLENEVQQLSEERRMRQEHLKSGKKDLEGQLADVCKAVSVMQGDVQYILNTLGFSQHLITGPLSQFVDVSGDKMPLMAISVGEGTCNLPPASMSEPRTPASSSVGLPSSTNEISKRHGTGLNSATSSSTEGAPVTNDVAATKEMLGRSDSGCLVTRPHEISTGDIAKTSQTNCTVLSGAAAVVTGVEPKRPIECLPRHDHRGAQKSSNTGFKVCRPPGSFTWPASMMSISQYTSNFTGSTSAKEIHVEEMISPSPRLSGGSTSSPGTSPIHLTTSARSAGDSHVAAAMAGMFSCMAQQTKVENSAYVSNTNTPPLPRLISLPQRPSFTHGSRGSWRDVHNHFSVEPVARGGELSRFFTTPNSVSPNQPRLQVGNTIQQQRMIFEGRPPSMCSTLPLTGVLADPGLIHGRQVAASDRPAMGSTLSPTSPQCPLPAGDADPPLSLSLSLSLGSQALSINSGKSVIKTAFL